MKKEKSQKVLLSGIAMVVLFILWTVAISLKKIIWKCKHGHEWEASVKSRTINGTGCPYCSHNKVLAGFNDLASQYPDIAAEWSDRNLPLLPTMVSELQRTVFSVSSSSEPSSL